MLVIQWHRMRLDGISNNKNFLLGSKINRFGCQKCCIRQLPVFTFTHSKHGGRLVDITETQSSSSQAGQRRKGQLRWERKIPGGKSDPERDNLDLILPTLQLLAPRHWSTLVPAASQVIHLPISPSSFCSLLSHCLSFLLPHPHKQP